VRRFSPDALEANIGQPLLACAGHRGREGAAPQNQTPRDRHHQAQHAVSADRAGRAVRYVGGTSALAELADGLANRRGSNSGFLANDTSLDTDPHLSWCSVEDRWELRWRRRSGRQGGSGDGHRRVPRQRRRATTRLWLLVIRRFLAVTIAIVVAGTVLACTIGRESWTFERALHAALASDDPELCDRINEEHVIQDMVLSPAHARDDCRVSYAIESEDVPYCLSLSDVGDASGWSMRDSCIGALARALNEPELCHELPSRGQSRYGAVWLVER
jgi:hypothetical protein